MSKRKFVMWVVMVLAMYLTVISISCCTQTRLLTTENLTHELLDIHHSIAEGNRIEMDMERAKIVFFSDLHRGMGKTDVFQKNKRLFEKILNHYFEQGYTLVYNGDIEEGWGYQRSNIPLILDNHGKQIEIEKKFYKENRYYRVYGNHDDYYRGQMMALDTGTPVRVYPALLFELTQSNGKSLNIFSTHGCQGHGLHDAGDDAAAWAVSLKYLWLIEFPKKKFKSDEQAIDHMEAVKKDYDKHEKYMLEWAFGDSRHPKCDIFIGGHTHRVVFESAFDPKMTSIMRRDYEEGRFRMTFSRGESEEILKNIPFKGKTADQMEKLTRLEQRVIKELSDMESEDEPPIRISDRFNRDRTISPVYFNSGCAFFSVIPCIEISGGKIRLVYIRPGSSEGLEFEVRREASLKKYI
jgi:UDP-2,3-diacylglucosamine pyrophosphatase LpxH